MSDLQANARIVDRDEQPGGLFVIRIAPEGWELPDFEPGQWITVGLPGVVDERGKPLKRVYSLASPPGLDHVELYVKHVDDGRFTTPLWGRGPGDQVWLDPRIQGGFTLEPVPPGKDVVLVATGTGLAPYVSMLKHLAGRGRWHRAVVIHGVRRRDELGYRGWLEDLAASDPAVTYLPVVSREPPGPGWTGLRGRVQQVFDADTYERAVRAPLDPSRCHVFLCGNPAMIDDMEQLLARLGFVRHRRREPGNLHFERYW